MICQFWIGSVRLEFLNLTSKVVIYKDFEEETNYKCHLPPFLLPHVHPGLLPPAPPLLTDPPPTCFRNITFLLKMFFLFCIAMVFTEERRKRKHTNCNHVLNSWVLHGLTCKAIHYSPNVRYILVDICRLFAFVISSWSEIKTVQSQVPTKYLFYTILTEVTLRKQRTVTYPSSPSTPSPASSSSPPSSSSSSSSSTTSPSSSTCFNRKGKEKHDTKYEDQSFHFKEHLSIALISSLNSS